MGITAANYWDETQVERLQQLYREGKSFSLIAAEIGVSRSAAIGKAHRLELPRRGVIIDSKRPVVVSVCPTRRRSTCTKTINEEPMEVIDPERDYRCTIYDLVDASCRYPLWQIGAPHSERLYCGITTACLSSGRPYCQRHSHLAGRHAFETQPA
jgi:hypothetical protein